MPHPNTATVGRLLNDIEQLKDKWWDVHTGEISDRTPSVAITAKFEINDKIAGKRKEILGLVEALSKRADGKEAWLPVGADD